MKEIKEFADFSGTDGYVIVDGITNADAGGKKLLSSIGGGGYNIVNVTPTDSSISNETYEMTIANKTLYIVDFSSLSEIIEHFSIIVPELNSGEYIDTILQIKPNGDDYDVTVKDSQGNRLPRLNDSGFYWYQNTWVQVKIFANCYELIHEHLSE